MPTDQPPPKLGTKPETSSAASGAAGSQPAGQHPLPAAAERALAEAAARRAEREKANAAQPKEIGGRDGPEPTRYGDWEIKGLTSDF